VFADPPLPAGLAVEVATVGNDLVFQVVPEPPQIASALAEFATLSILVSCRGMNSTRISAGI
jgi:hypothetical protein